MGFKIIIVGAGIAGLTLANMLEQLNIEYLLLEAHSNIAPELGTGIGLLPSGCRIFDQLGCFEKILQNAATTDPKFSFCSSDGSPINNLSKFNISHYVEQRSAIPNLILEFTVC